MKTMVACAGGLNWDNTKGIFRMKNIATALVAAQRNFAPALKSSTNPHFKSRYADLSACVEAVIDALNSAGIALMQKCYECENGVTVETVFIHESGEMLDAGKLHVPASKADAQGYGSALTYARRYSLMAACGIAPEDDDGNAASRPAKTPPKPDGMAQSAIADYITTINDAVSFDELKERFEAAFEAAKAANDKASADKFIAAKDARKITLTTKEPS